MDKDRSQSRYPGRLTSGIEQGKLSLETINFVRQQLSAWRDDPARPFGRSEPELNPQLCKFLNSRARDNFPMVQFSHEEPQGGHRSVDLSASVIESMLYSPYEPFLVFECKRLPAPSSDREKEYVTGGLHKNTGGIQRFKIGLYATDLQIVAMIGYVQKWTAQHWHDQINGWISQLSLDAKQDCCVWSDSDKLDRLEEDTLRGVASCKSAHARTGNAASSEVTIHHLWVVMNPRSQKGPNKQ